MSPHRPKPRDCREKEQINRKREKKAREKEFKQFNLYCPHCYKKQILLRRYRPLKKMIIYCSDCFCGDLISFKENSKKRYYWHKFIDRFRISWKKQKPSPCKDSTHYFNGEVYSGSLKDFKKHINEKLEKMVRKEIVDVCPFPLSLYPIDTDNPYNIFQPRDARIKFMEYREKKHFESLSKKEQEYEMEARAIKCAELLIRRIKLAEMRDKKGA